MYNYFFRALSLTLVLTWVTNINGQVSGNSVWSFRGGGSSVVRGTKGISDKQNTPGDRFGSIKFEDPENGRLFLYGGNGPGGVQYGDLWMFDASTEEWTWLSGTDLSGASPIYGTRGNESSNGFPGARFESFGWFDPNNNCLWLYGGGTRAGWRCDMWRFSLSSKHWSWVAGDNIANPPAFWPDPQDPNRITPGGVSTGVAWYVYNDIHPNQSFSSFDLGKKIGSKLFLFGGYYYPVGQKATMWVFTTDDNKWWSQDPLSACNMINNQQVCPYSREGSVAWQKFEMWSDPIEVRNTIRYRQERDALYVGGGYGIGSSGGFDNLADVWKFDVLFRKWTYVSGPTQANPPQMTNHPRIGWKNMATQNGAQFYTMGPMGPGGAQQVWAANYPFQNTWNKIYEGTGMVDRPLYEQSPLVKPDLAGGKTVWFAHNRLYVFARGRVWSYFNSCTNVSISASKTTINPGDTLIFSANANSDAATFQWRRNGQDIMGANDRTFTTWTLIHNDKITCASTIPAQCNDGKKVINISNEITIRWPSPENDLVCNAVELKLNSLPECRSNISATVSGESNGCRTPLNTLWYKYTPVSSGRATLTLVGNLAGNNPAGFVGVYTKENGNCPDGIQLADSTATILGGACQMFYSGFANPPTKWSPYFTEGKTYFFMVSAVNSNQLGTLCLSISTPPVPPESCASLQYPEQGDTTVPTYCTFKWKPVLGATSYELYLASPQSNHAFIRNFITSNTFATITLLANTRYFWYIRPLAFGVPVLNDCQLTAQSFNTGVAPQNDLPSGAISIIKNAAPVCFNNLFASNTSEPISGTTCGGINNNTVWFKYTPTITQRVQLNFGPQPGQDTLTGFMGIFVDLNSDGIWDDSTRLLLNDIQCGQTGTNTSQRFGVTLRSGVSYYIRFNGQADVGFACLSITDVEAPPTNCPQPMHPLMNQSSVTQTTLLWRSVPTATGYKVYFGTTNTPSLFAITTDTAFNISTLMPHTNYHWYVVPYNVGGDGVGCSVQIRSFQTASAPANMLPCNAIPLILDGNSSCGNNALANAAGNFTGQCYSNSINPLWYRFTPSKTEDYILTMSTGNDAFRGNFWLAAFTYQSGICAEGNLTLADSTIALFGACKFIFKNNPGFNLTNAWRVKLQAGKSYFFRITGFGGAVGNFCLDIKTANVYSLKNGNWFDPTVWNNGVVPLPQTAVSIQSAVTLTNSTTCLAITVKEGGNLQIGPGVKLELTGTNQ